MPADTVSATSDKFRPTRGAVDRADRSPRPTGRLTSSDLSHDGNNYPEGVADGTHRSGQSALPGRIPERDKDVILTTPLRSRQLLANMAFSRSDQIRRRARHRRNGFRAGDLVHRDRRHRRGAVRLQPRGHLPRSPQTPPPSPPTRRARRPAGPARRRPTAWPSGQPCRRSPDDPPPAHRPADNPDSSPDRCHPRPAAQPMRYPFRTDRGGNAGRPTPGFARTAGQAVGPHLVPHRPPPGQHSRPLAIPAQPTQRFPSPPPPVGLPVAGAPALPSGPNLASRPAPRPAPDRDRWLARDPYTDHQLCSGHQPAALPSGQPALPAGPVASSGPGSVVSSTTTYGAPPAPGNATGTTYGAPTYGGPAEITHGEAPGDRTTRLELPAGERKPAARPDAAARTRAPASGGVRTAAGTGRGRRRPPRRPRPTRRARTPTL